MTTLLSASPRDIAVHLAASAEASTELIHQLHELHSQQWALEDASRYTDATADQVAVAKGAIDSCNGRRHRLIDAIDASVTYEPSSAAGRHYSETIGELCDRLLIFDLKLDALVQRQSGDGERGAVDAIRQVCDHLSLHIAELLGDLAAGRALLPPRVGVKVYRPHRPPAQRRAALDASSPRK